MKNKENKKTKKTKVSKFNDRTLKWLGLVCGILIAIELLIMGIIYIANEFKINYVNNIYDLVLINNDYYISVGGSNLRYSKYNDSKIYKFYDEKDKGGYRKIVAEQAILTKYDSNLNVIWEKAFDSDYDSTFYDAIYTNDGYLAVGSYVYEYKQLEINVRDGLIVKYDLDGNMVWSKNLQILGDTEFSRALLVDDGYIVVGQSIYENMEIGNHDKGGGIIIKYDFDGNEVWRNNFGGNKSGIFQDIILVDGNYIACGKDANNYGLLASFNGKGKLNWVVNYANTDTFGFSNIKLLDNKLYIAGASNVYLENGDEENKTYEYDATMFIYDLKGKLLDKYTFGGNSDDRYNSFIFTDDGIIAVGHTESTNIDIDGINNMKNKNGIIVKYDNNFEIVKKIAYGGNEIDVLDTIIKSNGDNYIIGGYSNSRYSLFNGNNKDYQPIILTIDKNLNIINK